MRFLRYIALIAVLVQLLLLCGCGGQPEYMDPYGNGTRDPVTNSTISTRPYMTTTGIVLTPPTTTATTVPSLTDVAYSEEIPEGYQLCTTCGGVKTVCEYCGGTGRRAGQMLDPNTGIIKNYTTTCGLCMPEDVGYTWCDTCKNELIIPK